MTQLSKEDVQAIAAELANEQERRRKEFWKKELSPLRYLLNITAIILLVYIIANISILEGRTFLNYDHFLIYTIVAISSSLVIFSLWAIHADILELKEKKT